MLELALVHWAMDTLRLKGYTPLMVPDLVLEEVVSGCGFQPRGESTQALTPYAQYSATAVC